ncbi:hypothetical protein [Nonomuraea sp. NPDC005650]|uniref:hypothetical protein n=1 Tax=Nonomuraea sp. NPDC005650 TaxID=3157045 RepID=UPI0033A8749B
MDRRSLVPRTDAMLNNPRLAAAQETLGRSLVKAAVANAQQQVREGFADPDSAADVTLALLSATAGGLKSVVNATGVLLHTNLGRAPLSPAAVAAVTAAAGYTDVQFDLAGGQRACACR